MSVCKHRFLGMPSHKPRVWVDLSSTESKRAGLAMHRPGRKILQWAVKMLRLFAWLPIERLGVGPVLTGSELEGVSVLDRIRPDIRYATVYMGNDSVKSKLTVATDSSVLKLAKTKAAALAVRQEVSALGSIAASGIRGLSDCVPIVLDSGECDGWCWSEQTKVPRGKSPNRLQKEHYAFLGLLRTEGISHGDFTPWNCSIVAGRLYVYDWEDAGPFVEDKDESWFKKQVIELLGATRKS